MPGSIQNAAPATVLLVFGLPGVCTLAREYPVTQNEYRNGESERSVQASDSRKRWQLAKRLAPAALQVLRRFTAC